MALEKPQHERILSVPPAPGHRHPSKPAAEETAAGSPSPRYDDLPLSVLCQSSVTPDTSGPYFPTSPSSPTTQAAKAGGTADDKEGHAPRVVRSRRSEMAGEVVVAAPTAVPEANKAEAADSDKPPEKHPEKPPQDAPLDRPKDAPQDKPQDTPQESAAQLAVSIAAALGLRVCGMDLSELLLEQIAQEAETNRVVSAYQVMNRSHKALSAVSLKLLLRLKEPPAMLAQVLESARALLEPSLFKLSLPKPEEGSRCKSSVPAEKNMNCKSDPSQVVQPAPTDAPPAPLWSEITHTDYHMLMEVIDVDAITAEQLSQIEPSLLELDYERVRKAYGIASYLLSWVCAVAVIAGSAVATLPFENLETVQANRSASKRSLSLTTRARSCLGEPITGRPSYSSSTTAFEARTVPVPVPVQSCTGSPMGQTPTTSPGISPSDSPTFMRSGTTKLSPNPFGARRLSIYAVPTAKLVPSGSHSPGGELTRTSPRGAEAETRTDSTGTGADGAAAPATEVEPNAAGTLGRPPEKLSELEPLKFLGAGAFANVFMCRHKENGMQCALKCILKSVAVKKNKVTQVANSLRVSTLCACVPLAHTLVRPPLTDVLLWCLLAMVAQVLAEKEALSCEAHPCIISLYGTFADGQHLYFAMELALGEARLPHEETPASLTLSHVGSCCRPCRAHAWFSPPVCCLPIAPRRRRAVCSD